MFTRFLRQIYVKFMARGLVVPVVVVTATPRVTPTDIVIVFDMQGQIQSTQEVPHEKLFTATPDPVVQSTPTASPGEPFYASFFYPPYGGTNCDNNYDPPECRYLATGETWQGWVGRALACPFEFPLGTVFRINGDDWVCKDRGGMVNMIGGIPVLEFLAPEMPYGLKWFGIGYYEIVQ